MIHPLEIFIRIFTAASIILSSVGPSVAYARPNPQELEPTPTVTATVEATKEATAEATVETTSEATETITGPTVTATETPTLAATAEATVEPTTQPTLEATATLLPTATSTAALPPSLTMTSQPSPVEAGQVVTVSLTISNPQQNNLTGIQLQIPLTSDLIFLNSTNATNPITHNPLLNMLVWNVPPTTAAQVIVSYHLQISATYPDKTLSLAATLYNQTDEMMAQAQNDLSITPPVAAQNGDIPPPIYLPLIIKGGDPDKEKLPRLSTFDMVIHKSGPAQVFAGDPITYTLTVTNNQTITFTNLRISDTMPTAAHYLSGGIQDGYIVTWPAHPSLGPAEVLSVTFVVTAKQYLVNDTYSVIADGYLALVGQIPVTTSVYPPLKANFWADPLRGVPPLTVTFTNTTASRTMTTTWSFGDGSPAVTMLAPSRLSDTHSLSHTYLTPGLYTVTMSAVGPHGSNTLTQSSYIQVGLDQVIYVDAAASSGANSGLTWTDAYTELQSALAVALPGSEIWLAAGNYRPDYDPASQSYSQNRNATFNLPANIALYGGFAGSENRREQRDWVNNLTVLNGDLNGDDVGRLNNSENISRVVTLESVNTLTLEGVTIRGGQGSQGGGLYINNSQALSLSHLIIKENQGSDGGGLFSHSSALTLTHTLFTENEATRGGGLYSIASDVILSQLTWADNRADLGGGLRSINSDLALLNSQLKENHATTDGGGMASQNSDLVLINLLFTDNQAQRGGAWFSLTDTVQATNLTVSDNEASNRGGGLYLDQPKAGSTLHNTILWGNKKAGGVEDGAAQLDVMGNSLTQQNNLIQGWPSHNSTLNLDPQFVSAQDFSLQATSPAINQGDNLALQLKSDWPGSDPRLQIMPVDLAGNPRIIDYLVDMGAYEASDISYFSLSKEAHPAIALTGQPLTYTLTITNIRNLALNNIVITDVLPFGASYLNGGSLITRNMAFTANSGRPASGLTPTQIISWSHSGLAPGESVSVSFVVSSTTPLTNSHYAVSDGHDHTISGPALFTPMAPPQALSGLSLSNNSPAPLSQAVILTASLISGTHHTFNLNFGDGSTAYLQSPTINPHLYPAPGPYTATLTASNSLNQISTTSRITITAGPRLALSKQASHTSLQPGQPLTYTLIVTNSGTLPATNVLITDVLPAAAHHITGGTKTGNVISWIHPSLAPGSSLTLPLIISASQGVVNAQYSVRADNHSFTSGSPAVTTTARVKANFTASSPRTGRAPLTVIFINTTVGDIGSGQPDTDNNNGSYQWDFGDGQSSTDPDPVYSYTAAGQYTVTLTANGIGSSDTLTRSHLITVTPTVFYVDATANSGANTGLSWTDAYTELQSALAVAQPGDEIWLAAGSYQPDYNPANQSYTANRNATFQLLEGVALYGGFAGLETSRSQRDWAANPTLLSGDLAQNGNGAGQTSDNSYHVVTTNNVGQSTRLDGLTITGGYADDIFSVDKRGGGLLILNSSQPSLVNLIFTENAADLGGGLYNAGSSAPTLVNTVFISNTARRGGGMYNEANPTLSNVVFHNNSGGGFYNEKDNQPVLINATFSHNSGGGLTGGYQHDADVNILPLVYNSIFWSNGFRDVYWPDGSNWTNFFNLFDTDPLFVDADGADNIMGNLDDDLRLQTTSPAIDVGFNGVLPADITDLDNDGDTSEALPLDLAGKPRRFDISTVPDIGFGTAPVVDLGAYETVGLALTKSGPTTALANELITYTLAITNHTDLAATPLVITDAIPNGANYVSGGTKVNNVVSWTVASLASGETISRSFAVTASETITNSDYVVVADGGVSAVGQVKVTTIIRDWHLITSTTPPPIIGEQAMTYDDDRQQVIVYGGNATGWPYQNQTFEFDGSPIWLTQNPTTTPTVRAGAQMAYASPLAEGTEGGTILFGGTDETDTAHNQSWRYNGTTWELLSLTGSQPASRTHHSMVASSITETVYLFGGNDGLSYFNDLWQYKDSTWTDITPTSGPRPPARTLAAMAYASPPLGGTLPLGGTEGGQLLLYGGRTVTGTILGDLWAYNLTTNQWQLLDDGGGGTDPPPRMAHSLTYDPLTESAVLVGGTPDNNNTLLGDTWHYAPTTGTWAEAASSLPARAYHQTVYTDNQLLLFSNGEVWIYE